MKCFKCDSTHMASRTYTMRELKKGSPKRGKNKEYVTITVKEWKCRDCQSCSLEYSQ
ncbi:hypothetical protein NDAWWUGD_CDS0086 [Salmonella phage SeKF_80]|uniref:Uncharacterized protein n=1 Tax=Salmonella phage 7-11 TaxID=1054968 RepID=G0X509_9CAUD|nr:hypothetical protein SaPh711_gp076 [Salmonella phage 7-11]AEK81991.1 hypothetical protein [Salmonella phage 7-11]